jgi:replicative DNA helicase
MPISFFPSAEAEAELLRQLVRGRRPLPDLHPGDFSLPAHRLIWRAMVALAYRRLWIDPQTVAAQLSRLAPGNAADLEASLGRILKP